MGGQENVSARHLEQRSGEEHDQPRILPPPFMAWYALLGPLSSFLHASSRHGGAYFSSANGSSDGRLRRLSFFPGSSVRDRAEKVCSASAGSLSYPGPGLSDKAGRDESWKGLSW